MCATMYLFSDPVTYAIHINESHSTSEVCAYNKDVASNKVATLRSVQSRIANIFCVMLCVIGKQQKSRNANSYDQPSLAF